MSNYWRSAEYSRVTTNLEQLYTKLSTTGCGQLWTSLPVNTLSPVVAKWLTFFFLTQKKLSCQKLENRNEQTRSTGGVTTSCATNFRLPIEPRASCGTRRFKSAGSIRRQQIEITSLPRCELRNVNGWSDNGKPGHRPVELGHWGKDLCTRRDQAWLFPGYQNHLCGLLPRWLDN